MGGVYRLGQALIYILTYLKLARVSSGSLEGIGGTVFNIVVCGMGLSSRSLSFDTSALISQKKAI